jgi:DNA-binding transcriptional LysR family regulator
MELRHLRYFVVLAEELHFGRAARRLFIAQPPLSQQIRQLEEELEVPLFRRTNRRVELTDAGQAFLREARHILVQVEEAKMLAQRTARGEMGELSLGFVSSAILELLPRLLYAYRERYPHIHVTLYEMRRDELIAALFSGQIQLGMLRPAIHSTELAAEVIQRESVLVALPAKHPLAARETIPLIELRNETFVMLPRHWGSSFYDLIISLCQSAGFSPNVTQEAGETHTIIALVSANIGVAIVPASAQFVHSRSVVYRHLEGNEPQIEMAMAWRVDNHSPVVQAFLELVREETRLSSDA